MENGKKISSNFAIYEHFVKVRETFNVRIIHEEYAIKTPGK